MMKCQLYHLWFTNIPYNIPHCPPFYRLKMDDFCQQTVIKPFTCIAMNNSRFTPWGTLWVDHTCRPWRTIRSDCFRGFIINSPRLKKALFLKDTINGWRKRHFSVWSFFGDLIIEKRHRLKIQGIAWICRRSAVMPAFLKTKSLLPLQRFGVHVGCGGRENWSPWFVWLDVFLLSPTFISRKIFKFKCWLLFTTIVMIPFLTFGKGVQNVLIISESLQGGI